MMDDTLTKALKRIREKEAENASLKEELRILKEENKKLYEEATNFRIREQWVKAYIESLLSHLLK